ncbi:MAG: alpha/beta fold hydrolase [Acidobacteriota bacterium]|nr:alpha/beta fold hydrolase [Acidobacteriota bacterium]
MNKQVITALSFIAVFAFCNQMFAQMKDTGTYIVYVGSQAVAEENYTSEKLADGADKTVSKVATTTFTTTTRNDKPVEFTIEANGAKVLATTFSGGEAKTLIGEQPAKIIKTDATVITENNLWSNFINLLAQYDRKKGGAQSFVAFLPSQSLTLSVSLEKTGAKDFRLKNQTVSLSRYKLVHTKSGLELVVLANDSNIPYFIEIPSQQAQIVKKGFEELREMTAPPKTKLMNFTGEFTSEEVSFPNGENTLAGTLTIPKNDKKMFPAIVIISGSGGQDRDGSQLFNLYKQIAESLSKTGVAVLRFDDRGIGKSTVDMKKAAEISYQDLILDSRAAFDYLTTRKEVEKTKIGFLGHSEGAETALTIASEDKRVAAILLLAGVSRPVNEAIFEQEIYQRALRETVNASDKTKIMSVAQMIITQFEAAKLPQNANDVKFAYFREHLASNPSLIAAKVKCPVLIVQGERDALVLAYHSIELSKALANNGNKNVSLRIVPNQTHIFSPAVGDNPQETSKISEEMLQTLQNWAFANLIEKQKP